jgi:hypothetical protein
MKTIGLISNRICNHSNVRNRSRNSNCLVLDYSISPDLSRLEQLP